MKFKKIPKEYFPTILDRLSRFEPANIRFKRVFDDIINKFSLSDKLKNLTLEDEIKYVEEIFNASVDNNNFDTYINDTFIEIEKKYFTFNQESYQYLSSRLNISQMINEITINENSPKNLVWLKQINNNKTTNIYELKKQYSLLYPIEKIILCEGQTEYTLLSTLFKLFNMDFDKNGVLVLAAGGKNQVARKYYKMLEYVKLPFFILLDKDAMAQKDLIEAKLRICDSIYLINSGEFEDLIPKNILQKTINYIHKNELNCVFEDFCTNNNMVLNLCEIYRKYGFGEFKKAQFAIELNEYILNNCTPEDFAGSEINEIVKSFSKPIHYNQMLNQA